MFFFSASAIASYNPKKIHIHATSGAMDSAATQLCFSRSMRHFPPEDHKQLLHVHNRTYMVPFFLHLEALLTRNDRDGRKNGMP